MDRAYGWIYDACNGNEFFINVVVGVAVVNVFFYMINSIFVLIDVLDMPWSRKFKVQQNKKPALVKYVDSLKLVLFNQLVTATVTTAFFHYPMKLAGVSFEKRLPDLLTVLSQIVVCILVEEIGFYYTHRLFHHPRLYKHIHKIHHEWTTPVSITSIYCHPIEHAFSNLSPVLIGPVICGSHVTTIWIWACVAVMSTTFSHSGYHFPLQPSPEAHDYHHKVALLERLASYKSHKLQLEMFTYDRTTALKARSQFSTTTVNVLLALTRPDYSFPYYRAKKLVLPTMSSSRKDSNLMELLRYEFARTCICERSPHSIDRFNECFGVLGILDYLHGTAVNFRSSVHFKRHVTYFRTKPIKELYPDEEEKSHDAHSK